MPAISIPCLPEWYMLSHWGADLLFPVANGDFAGSAFRNGRRTCLPAPCPDTSNINLWNILRNNIGKDLSKVSMPVELNEPLNTLQRMCEELEYSELLDKAADTEDPFERMVRLTASPQASAPPPPSVTKPANMKLLILCCLCWIPCLWQVLVAAFAVSGYSSTYYRAGSKPFNPLLGETYECIREDKGFCFFSEQVSLLFYATLHCWNAVTHFYLILKGESPPPHICLLLWVQELHLLAR